MIIDTDQPNIKAHASIDDTGQVDSRFAQNPSSLYDVSVGYEIELETQYLPLGGGQFLALWENPVLKYNQEDFSMQVQGWGIRLDAQDVSDAPKKMARQFLLLWEKSKNDVLSEEEQKIWTSISDQVDYARFCSDRALPRYMEGTVLQRQPDKIRVEWHDGALEWVKGSALDALELIEKNERFSAFVREDRRVGLQLVNVSPLAALSELTEETFESWPKAN